MLVKFMKFIRKIWYILLNPQFMMNTVCLIFTEEPENPSVYRGQNKLAIFDFYYEVLEEEISNLMDFTLSQASI